MATVFSTGLVFGSRSIENSAMEILQGRVHNGVVVLEGGRVLPEGTAVTVSYNAEPVSNEQDEKKRVEFPLVHSKNPGTLNLTNERIAQIMEEEDVSPRR